jgi:hypothetical protein
LDFGTLDLQYHVLEGVKLKGAGDHAIVAKVYRIPIEYLQGHDKDCPAANATSHPPQNSVRKHSSCQYSQRNATPREETILSKKVGEVTQGPEWC